MRHKLHVGHLTWRRWVDAWRWRKSHVHDSRRGAGVQVEVVSRSIFIQCWRRRKSYNPNREQVKIASHFLWVEMICQCQILYCTFCKSSPIKTNQNSPPGSPGTGSSRVPISLRPSLPSFPLAAWDLKQQQTLIYSINNTDCCYLIEPSSNQALVSVSLKHCL